jgi:hypothetical protein
MVFDAIDNYEDLANVSAENVRFHSTFKSIFRMLIKYLPFAHINEEEYAQKLSGNSRIFYEEIKRMESLDNRDHQKGIYAKPGIFLAFLTCFDSDFRERFDYFLFRLIQRAHEFRFHPAHLDPGTWCNNEGQRRIPGFLLTDEMITAFDGQILITREVLHPRQYWFKHEPSGLFFGVDTNRPVWDGKGWRYLVTPYGEEETFRRDIFWGPGEGIE